MEPKIKIEDYTYLLPDNRIAKYPLENRDSSKILIFKDKSILESKFSNLSEFIPSSPFVVFNNTKVVPARLFFKKPTGAIIEIFCLEPNSPSEYNLSFASKGACEWICVVGNVKRWKDGPLFYHAVNEELDKISLKAYKIGNYEDKYIIRFEWSGDYTFSNVLEMCGRVPIPPYLKRDSEVSDTERYQTVYARYRGSVAAPTAGLHFTDSVIDSLKGKGASISELCLHVGAGTFIPVKSEYIKDHIMHSEPFSVNKAFVKSLIDAVGKRKIIAVGTTSTRCLESLYYLGVHCIERGEPGVVLQWEPYSTNEYGVIEALSALYDWLCKTKLEEYNARTQIIIVPSYKFKIVDILITNFHQPQSTLLLLIAAFIGESWRDVYNYALEHDFRFLSYGDSSMLIR